MKARLLGTSGVGPLSGGRHGSRYSRVGAGEHVRKETARDLKPRGTLNADRFLSTGSSFFFLFIIVR